MRKKLLTGVIVLAICSFHLIPFYILINLSLKTIQDTSSRLVPPNYLYLDNFIHAWTDGQFGRAFLNTVIITASSVALIVALGALAAYPLARFTTRWNNFIYILCVSIMIVPPLTILVPLYKFIVDNRRDEHLLGDHSDPNHLLAPHLYFHVHRFHQDDPQGVR